MAEQENVASKNIVNVVGTLKENKLKVEADKITGSVIVQYGENADDQVEVGVYVKDKTSKGEISKRYTNLKDLAETAVTVATATEERPADVVSIFGNEPFSPQIQLDDYASNGVLKSSPKVKLGFGNISRTDKRDFKGEFEMDVFLHQAPKMKDDILIVNALYVTYKGEVKPLEFVVRDEDLISGIEDCAKGDTIEIFGDIKIAKIVSTTTKASGFGGKAKTDEKVTYSSELLITGGNPIDEDDDRAIASDFVKTALVERESMLEQIKSGTSKTTNANKPNSFAGGGSTTKDDDLPF